MSSAVRRNVTKIGIGTHTDRLNELTVCIEQINKHINGNIVIV